MFRFKPIIFDKYFGRADKASDPNKDVNSKGTNERFQEILANDWDEELLPLVDNILDNTLVPETMLEKFIPYIEQMLGIDSLVDDMSIRRKIIQNIMAIYKVKGTLRSYEILFKLLGFNSVTIEEIEFQQGFDSPVTFDAVTRVFDDSPCQTCSQYDLILTGAMPLTTKLLDLINRAVLLVEPINAKRRKIIYNLAEVENFSIFVASNGDLIFDPLLQTVTDFNSINDGDLEVTGNQSNSFTTDNGNLLQDE